MFAYPEQVLFSASSVRGILTKRLHGFSNFPQDSYNFSFTVSDALTNVIKNRFFAAKSIGIPLNRWIIPGQSHTTNIQHVNHNHIGSGVFLRHTAIPNVDAVWTQTKGIALAVSTADCLVLTLYDPINNAVAAIHSGWRGCASGIVIKLLNQWKIDLNSDPNNVLVWIGSYISGTIYELGIDAIQEFGLRSPINHNKLPSWFSRHHDHNKLYFDQNRLVTDQLVNEGINPDNINRIDGDGFTDASHHFSHRLEKGNTGRSIMAIALI